jgi:hypothetical protein
VVGDAHDDRLEARTVAQRPPVFPTFQDQRDAADEDERYFADLRATPDEDDPFARPRDDSWNRHPSGGWETADPDDDFDAIRPRTDEFDSIRPRSGGSDSIRPRSDEFETIRPRSDEFDSIRPRSDEFEAIRPRSDEFEAIRPRRRDDDYVRERPAADPWGDDPGARLDDAYAVPDFAEADAPAGPAWRDPRGPDPDDPYRRSDIVQESQTDPSGWKATGPAQPPIPDDRPPAEALSGNRLLTVLLFFSGLATSVSFWLFDTPGGSVNDTATL